MGLALVTTALRRSLEVSNGSGSAGGAHGDVPVIDRFAARAESTPGGTASQKFTTKCA
jgi:hypothetical protein